jgi:hypothetical protein
VNGRALATGSPLGPQRLHPQNKEAAGRRSPGDRAINHYVPGCSNAIVFVLLRAWHTIILTTIRTSGRNLSTLYRLRAIHRARWKSMVADAMGLQAAVLQSGPEHDGMD